MQLTEYESLQECIDALTERHAIHEVRVDPDGHIIDKKHGYRVKYIVPEKTDPSMDLGHGMSMVAIVNNKFKDTKSVVAPVYFRKEDSKMDPDLEEKFIRENYNGIASLDKISIFNGLFMAIAKWELLWEDFGEFGLIIISDMMYEHRKNALEILFSIMQDGEDS